MSTPPAPSTDPSSPPALAEAATRQAPLTALTVTLAVQMIATLAMTCPSVLAPVIAGELGIGAQHVGWLVSLAYLAAMISGLNGGWMAMRHGSVRTSQGALLSSGLALLLMATAHPVGLLAGALLLGVGYGLTNPAAADILSRHAPIARRGLFFSIKQTGVPLGVAMTGLAMPALLLTMRWPQALLLLSGFIGICLLAIGPSRRALEPQIPAGGAPAPDAALGSGSMRASIRTRLIAPLREVMSFGPTRRLALTSLVYAFVQVSFLTFLVSLMKLEHHYTLALAASLLSLSQAASVVARVGWGHVADRWMDPTRLLGLLGLLMGAGVMGLGLAPADTPASLMMLITLASAATAVSWNGVYYADLVRHVPAHRVAQTTGATQFLTFLGGMSGSAIFAGLVSLSGSYGRVFAGLSLLPIATGVVLLLAARRPASLSTPVR